MAKKTATIYRMVTNEHVCPFGIKSKQLLQRQGFEVEDKPLTSRDETDAFKKEYGVETTPQTFIDGERVGGYDDLKAYFGKASSGAGETSYQPIVAVFAMTALMALAATYAQHKTVLVMQSAEWFIAISMCVLGILKLRDVSQFSNQFVTYDLLARREVRYAYFYPFAEAGAGVLMIAGLLPWVSIPVALFIGTVGAASVIKAVYIDKRDLKCACVGGDSNVPLGAISLTENVMMILMALYLVAR